MRRWHVSQHAVSRAHFQPSAVLAKSLADSVAQVSAVQCGPYDYTRSGNPTRAQLEAHMADLEVLSSNTHRKNL